MSPPAWRARVSERILVRIGALAVEAPFVAVQQLRQRVPVMHVSWREHRAMRQRRSDGPHRYAPLLPSTIACLCGLVHLGVARVLLILRPARRAANCGAHDGAARELRAAGLKHPADLGKQLLAQFVSLRQAPERERRHGVRRGFVGTK
jgi:hypothetical protein